MTTDRNPTADLLAPPLARMMRSSRRSDPATLSHTDGYGRRVTRGGRLNDGFALALAAYYEIVGQEPVYTVRQSAKSADRVNVRPWRRGKADAWEYLRLTARDRPFGGMARDLLARLERESYVD